MADASSAPRLRLWLRLVLFASLALNLLVVGVIVGVIASGGPPARGGLDRGDLVTPYTRAMTEAQRTELRRALRRGFLRERLRHGGLPQAEDYRAAQEILMRDPFDRAALAQVLDRQADGARQRLALGQVVLLDFLDQMTPADRRAYADRLAQEIDRRHRHGGSRPTRE